MSSKLLLFSQARLSKLLKTVSNILRFCLEMVCSLGLRIVSQTTKWKKSNETAKVATFKDRRRAAVGALLHAVPLAAVLALITINLRVTYVAETTTTTTRTAIQFAAKILESMIQASLAAICLHFIRHEVLGSQSFPLGSFFAPYRIMDISYLWSLELWGSVTATWRRRRIVLAISIPGIILLVTLIGPSSAVLLIPRPISFQTYRTLMLLDEMAAILPASVELKNGTVSYGPLKAQCYLADLAYSSEALLQTEFPQLAHELDLTASSSVSFQIADDKGARTMENTISECMLSSDGTYCGTSTLPTRSVLSAFAAYPYHLSKTITSRTQSLQPYVQQSDVVTTINGSESLEGQYVYFGYDHSDINGLVPLSSLFPTTNKSGADSNPGVTITNQNETLSWYEMSQTKSNYSLLMTYAVDQGISKLVTASVIGAKWAWAKTTTNITQEHVSVQIQSSPENGTWLAGASQAISISPDWAKKVTDLYINASTLTDVDTLEFVSSFMTSIIALALSDASLDPSITTDAVEFYKNLTTGEDGSSFEHDQYDAISRFIEPYRRQYTDILVVCNNRTDLDSLIHYPIQAYIHGYGYDSSTTPVKLSIVVLGIYSLIALAFLSQILISGRFARSWDSVGEIFLLALNSRQPEHLHGASVGVETLATYREPVNIRVNDKNGSAEMVFRNDPGFRKSDYSVVKPNAKY